MKYLKIAGLVLTLLVAVISYNTVNFTRENVHPTALIDNSSLDKQALAKRLAQAISHKTISYMEPERFDARGRR